MRAHAMPRGWASIAGLSAFVVLAVALRGVNLGWPPLWTDEAESAINALTIVSTGLPGDHYLGVPIYENTLVRPWPGSEEYEFRDLSYSDRGLAIYHGWLPLYAIAAAFRLAGVTAQEARRGPPAVDGSTAELVHWTAVPRWPSLAFSALLVLFAFQLGRRVGGAGADWAMALATSVSGLFVWLGRQARYYSLTLALDAAGGLAVWNACRRGRFRDHALAGLAAGLLFHTHAVTAVSLVALYALALPFAPSQRSRLAKAALAGTIAALLVLPWAWWSGLLFQATYVPAARQLLSLGSLVRSLPPAVWSTIGLTLASVAFAAALRGRLRERWRRSLADLAPGLGFALAWIVVSYVGFVALMPAPSYFVTRLKLAVAVPAVLMTSLLVTALARALRPTAGPASAAAAMLVLLVVSGQVHVTFPEPGVGAESHEVARLVRSWTLAPGARVYAMPNSHLIVTYYGGRPVQSVSAVRKSWLDRFPGDLVVLDTPRYEGLPAGTVAELARARGLTLDAEQAAVRSRETRQLATAIDVAGKVQAVDPSPRPLGPLEQELRDAMQQFTRQTLALTSRGTPLEGTAPLTTWTDFWQFFFYWFAEPATRTGDAANFAERVRSARAYVLPSGWVVYDCRASRGTPLVPSRASPRDEPR
jgi:hypothetical protein